MEYFNDNPTITIAIAVFLICVIIGFFADKRLKKQNEMKKMLSNMGNQKTDNSASSETITSRDLTTPEENNVSSMENNTNYSQATFQPSGQNILNTSNLNSGYSEPINQNNFTTNNFPNNTSYETASEISPYGYPSENKPQDVAPTQSALGGQTNVDDSFNNIF